MCGIIFGKRKDKHPVSKAVWKRFQKQRTRGLRGFGYIPVEKGYVKRIERAETEDEIEKKLEKETASEILFHHRAPTGGTPNIEELTHPIEVKSKKLSKNYYVVHNGVIHNADTLKKKHNEMGFVYTTEVVTESVVKTKKGVKTTSYESKFNDTEALAIELALYFDGQKEEIGTRGAVAFICYETNKKGKILKMHYGRNTNPLTTEDNGDLFFLRSEGGEEKLDNDQIVTVDYATQKSVINDVSVGDEYGTGKNYNWHRTTDSDEINEPPPVGVNVGRKQTVDEPTYLEFLHTRKHAEAIQDEIDTLESEIQEHQRLIDQLNSLDKINDRQLENLCYNEDCLAEDKVVIKTKRHDLEQIELYLDEEEKDRSLGFKMD